MRLFAMAVVLSSSFVFAMRPGDVLYVVAKDTVVLKDVSPKSAKVTTLQRGTEVKWMGPSEKNKALHLVNVRGKSGYVLGSSLSPNRPALEIDAATGKPISAQAFASSGSATKGYPPHDTKYAANPKQEEAQKELAHITELNLNAGTPEALEQKRLELSK